MEPREPIPDGHKIGAVFAVIGWFVLCRHALELPHSRQLSPERLIFLGYGLIASALLAYAWGVLMAFVARSREWTPRGCRSAGFPLMALGLFAQYLTVVGGPNVVAIGRAGVAFGGLLAAELAGRVCRRLAFPELGWSGKEQERASSSIAPSRPDAFDNRPIG